MPVTQAGVIFLCALLLMRLQAGQDFETHKKEA
jgi:hypothetical protein